MKEINTNEWARKEQFNFFKDFTDPTMGITSNIECTNLYLTTKNKRESFFIHYMHKALMVMNKIQEFKLRIINNKVVEYPSINGTTTVFKEDKTFAFSYFNYYENFEAFYVETQKALEIARESKHLYDKPMMNLIYVSVIPWRGFTCIKHPSSTDSNNSIPKIVFGKVFKREEKYFMPVSLEAHHALVDGYHVSEFFNQFEKLMI